ncbi:MULTISPECIES: sigma 54-interacting transcriptional regulator [Clostridia]|uniref:sigma-54 interaction domain-containing protein n=1 Tax=Clostridia TaxID=186801 RepID=UPI000EA11913|nr:MULTISPECIES: sigma 54-interacting transcriptional regulator [Clostridia]NBJ69659.1 AAA family ATPase [Roseburia sp. 1XD42-34]RKI78287.1 AAA family ATPase [Clostridium sp. 1xD42-85]
MANLPELLVVAHRITTLQTIVGQLNDVGFTKHCKITGALVKDMESQPKYGPELALVTSEAVFDMVKSYLHKDVSCIIAKRLINFARIKPLLSLPKGSRVYVVNNMKDSAEEAIRTLLEAGVEHFYVPYYGQKELDPTITIAVTPGESQMVPPSIKTKIDIGNRLLDMTTLYEIYEFFNISTYASNNQLSARYIQSIISLVKELNFEITQSQGLQKSLEGIVEQIEEGMIVYDKYNQIISINKQAMKQLNRSYTDLISENMNQIPFTFYQAFMKAEMGKENFIDMEGETYYVRKKRVFVGVKVFATIILFDKMERIKSIEAKYHKNEKEKGFIAKYTFADIKTSSSEMLTLIRKAEKLARSDSTIFISGETGTGKEVMAQAIHRTSERNKNPFVAVNLAAIPESLVESELFGYEKGAFTGASQTGNMGLFERAHKGTVFLDEIGDASAVVQNRLLRVLQEREIQRVGGGQPIPIDIRVIAATNKDLQKLIQENKFREDLYYRLNILPIRLIPLRKRKEDILLLSELFAKEFEEKLQRGPLHFSKEVIEVMTTYEWPGNVRELRNTIEYLAHICDDVIKTESLPPNIMEQQNTTDSLIIDEWETHYHVLKEKGFLQDCNQILTILHQLGGISVGRSTLLKSLSEYNQSLSEQKLRYRLEVLSSMDLVTVGKGRRGTSINENGRQFLQFLESKVKRPIK